jgi:uncharacterized protein YggE
MSEETPLDLIVVTAFHTAEVEADRVDLSATVHGSSFFTGRAALAKAKEVRKLLESLMPLGISEADVTLEGVSVASEKGLFSRSSSAHYQLKVRCSNLDTLAELLGAISAQGNTYVGPMKWGYGSLGAAQAELLRRCAAEVESKARGTAEALGVSLLGIHRFTEKFLDEEEPLLRAGGRRGLSEYDGGYGTGAFAVVPSAVPSPAGAGTGLAVSHRKTIAVLATAEYRIARNA